MRTMLNFYEPRNRVHRNSPCRASWTRGAVGLISNNLDKSPKAINVSTTSGQKIATIFMNPEIGFIKTVHVVLAGRRMQ